MTGCGDLGKSSRMITNTFIPFCLLWAAVCWCRKQKGLKVEEETEMAGDHQDPRNRVFIALAAGTKGCAWELHSP